MAFENPKVTHCTHCTRRDPPIPSTTCSFTLNLKFQIKSRTSTACTPRPVSSYTPSLGQMLFGGPVNAQHQLPNHDRNTSPEFPRRLRSWSTALQLPALIRFLAIAERDCGWKLIYCVALHAHNSQFTGLHAASNGSRQWPSMDMDGCHTDYIGGRVRSRWQKPPRCQPSHRAETIGKRIPTTCRHAAPAADETQSSSFEWVDLGSRVFEKKSPHSIHTYPPGEPR